MDLQDKNLVSILHDFKTFLTEEQQRKLKLPSIVVVGAENNGKSSVLQRIMGMKLLPTKAGVCTRCPIQVSIIENRDIQDKFRLSIKEVCEDQLITHKFEEEDYFECDEIHQIQDQVTSVIDTISDNRKSLERSRALNSLMSRFKSLSSHQTLMSVSHSPTCQVTPTRRVVRGMHWSKSITSR